MLDAKIFQLVRQDFISRSALELRPYTWSSLDVYEDAVKSRMSTYHSKYDLQTLAHLLDTAISLVISICWRKRYESILRSSFEKHQHVLGMLFSKECVEAKPHKVMIFGTRLMVTLFHNIVLR